MAARSSAKSVCFPLLNSLSPHRFNVLTQSAAGEEEQVLVDGRAGRCAELAVMTHALMIGVDETATRLHLLGTCFMTVTALDCVVFLHRKLLRPHSLSEIDPKQQQVQSKSSTLPRKRISTRLLDAFPSIFDVNTSLTVTNPITVDIPRGSCSVMEPVYLRDGKMTYFRLRYRIRIITVFVLRMWVWRKVMLKLLSFFAFSSVSVLMRAYKSIGFVL